MADHEILAIDPGNEQSAWVCYDPLRRRITDKNISANGDLLDWLPGLAEGREVACEMIASYGMPVGREVFETCLWIGRFVQAVFPQPVTLIYRRDVKMHLCNSARAKDSNIRQALADLFGGNKACKGTKNQPGPLYGFHADLWAGLGVAVTMANGAENPPT